MARQSRDDYDDDFDDRPRRRRPVDDDDDEADERISSRKRSPVRSRYDDEDDDYDDRPRKKKKAGSKGLIIGLSVGGGVLVLAIVGVVLFLVLKGGSTGDTQKLLVGTWQMEGAPIAITVQFTADGKFIENTGFINLNHKYKVINATTIEVEMLAGNFGNLGDLMGKFKDFPGVPADFMGKFKDFPGVGDFKMPNVPNLNLKQNLTVRVSQNQLTITDPAGISKNYRRVN
jgi:hypothetical protein